MEHTETKLEYIIENQRLREINAELLEALETYGRVLRGYSGVAEIEAAKGIARTAIEAAK